MGKKRKRKDIPYMTKESFETNVIDPTIAANIAIRSSAIGIASGLIYPAQNLSDEYANVKRCVQIAYILERWIKEGTSEHYQIT